MIKLEYNGEYFNVKDTLECGQVFRFRYENGAYKVCSADKFCRCYDDGNGKAVVECEKEDADYFAEFFDVARDYSAIVKNAISRGGVLAESAKSGKGIRILNQNKREMLFSFIVSQNNNIPRIKGIIERLCAGAGEKKNALGEEYYAFPTPERLKDKSLDFFRGIGLGYRAEYIKRLSENVSEIFNEKEFSALPSAELKKRLTSIYGVGPKVADCVRLFGFHRSDSFPVDTWIEKIYREDFKGTLKDRNAITEYFEKET